MAWNDEPQPTLTTAHLILRPFRADDAPTVDELAGDRRIADTTASIPHPYPADGSRDWIATHPRHWAEGAGMEFALVERHGQDRPVGAIGPRVHSWTRSAILGYWIGVPFWGRGYATEAATAVIAFAFEVIGLNRVEAQHLVRNPASGRVMEKAGMVPEGIFREAAVKWGIPEDVAQRAILRSDWAARRGG